MTSQLIGRFSGAAHAATRERFGAGPLTRYDANLVVPDDTLAEIVVLKGVTAHYVMAPRENEPVYLHQRTMLTEITEALLAAGPAEVHPPFVADCHAAEDDPPPLPLAPDHVAPLTDRPPHPCHTRLCT